MEKVRKHFQQHDPVLFTYLLKVNLPPLRQSSDYFASLCDEIVSQQLSSRAASTIFNRFKILYPKGKISAEYTLTIPDQDIRNAGMAWSKVSFIKDLAGKVVAKELLLEELDRLTNEEVMKTLTRVKGIGPWTAEMFLMFSLAREDVFSHGDLGLRKALKKLYGFKREPTQRQVEKIVSKWSPYRTYGCMVLWRSLEL